MKKIKGILISMLLIATILTIIGTTTVSAEDPPNEDCFVVGYGTYFEITNSDYLNISLTSVENVYVMLSSYPSSVDYYIDSNCSANTTEITLSGFEACKTYYMYEDGNLTGDFTTDETGSISYTRSTPQALTTF